MSYSRAACVAEVNIKEKPTHTFRFFRFPLSQREARLQQFLPEPYEMVAGILLNSLKPLSRIDQAGPELLPALSR